MPKKVQLEPHLSVEELYTRYRTSERVSRTEPLPDPEGYSPRATPL